MTAPLSRASAEELGRVARGGALNLVGAVFSALESFLLVVLVANRVDTKDAGALFAATSLLLILLGVATLGSEAGLARFLLPLESQHRYSDLLATIRTAAIPIAVTSGALSVVLLVAAPWLAPLVGLSGAKGSTLIRVVALALPFGAAMFVALATTRAFGRMRPTVLVDKFLSNLLQIGLVAIAAAIGWGAIGLTVASMLPYVIAAAVGVVVASRLLAKRRRRWENPAEQRGDMPREYWTYTWPRAIATTAQLAVQRLDIVLVALLLGASAAAVYTASTRFVAFGQLAGQAIYRILQPRFSAIIGRDDTNTLRDVFRISTAWTMATSWPIYIVVACGAPLYLRLFGSGYTSDGLPVVIVMAVAMMFAMAAGPLDTLLLMAGHSVASLLIAITTLVTDVVLCLVLIPTIGIAGAAVAWAAAVVINNSLGYWQVRRATGLVPWSSSGAIVGGACLLTLVLPLTVVGILTDWSPLLFGLATVGGLAAYAGLLWAARQHLALDVILDSFGRNRSRRAVS
jgi:O-antigen/teichoic acid export membrane protein